MNIQMQMLTAAFPGIHTPILKFLAYLYTPAVDIDNQWNSIIYQQLTCQITTASQQLPSLVTPWAI